MMTVKCRQGSNEWKQYQKNLDESVDSNFETDRRHRSAPKKFNNVEAKQRLQKTPLRYCATTRSTASMIDLSKPILQSSVEALGSRLFSKKVKHVSSEQSRKDGQRWALENISLNIYGQIPFDVLMI